MTDPTPFDNAMAMIEDLRTQRDAAEAEVARLREALRVQSGALKQFEVANARIAMARAPQNLKDAVVTARANEAGVQAANAMLTEEVESLAKDRYLAQREADAFRDALESIVGLVEGGTYTPAEVVAVDVLTKYPRRMEPQ